MGRECTTTKMGQNILEDLLQVKNMEMEFLYLQTELKYKDSGTTIIQKDQQKYTIIMEISMKVIFTCHRSRVKGPIDGINNNKGRFNIKAHLRKTTQMDLPLLDLVMDRSTKERSKMEKEMDKGYINIAMEINLKVNGKMIKSKSENMFSVQVIISKVDLNKDKCPLD